MGGEQRCGRSRGRDRFGRKLEPGRRRWLVGAGQRRVESGRRGTGLGRERRRGHRRELRLGRQLGHGWRLDQQRWRGRRRRRHRPTGSVRYLQGCEHAVPGRAQHHPCALFHVQRAESPIRLRRTRSAPGPPVPSRRFATSPKTTMTSLPRRSQPSVPPAQE